MKSALFTAGLLAATALAVPAQADKLDDIIASGTLRCAVVLDFPPMGSRDADNNPIGFDVDYCNDLAKALGVTAEIVETPFPDRIPALVSGRVDVGVASTSDTLERAKTVGFSIPYFAFEMVVTASEKSGIKTFDDMKGKTVGATAGTFEAIALEKQVTAWGGGEFRPGPLYPLGPPGGPGTGGMPPGPGRRPGPDHEVRRDETAGRKERPRHRRIDRHRPGDGDQVRGRGRKRRHQLLYERDGSGDNA